MSIDRDFEQVSEEHMKSMTKQEGPAQEPQETSDPSWTKWDLAKVAFPPATPAPSQPTVTLDRETFDRLIAKGESVERAAVHGTFYHTVAIELLALLRAAEQK